MRRNGIVVRGVMMYSLFFVFDRLKMDFKGKDIPTLEHCTREELDHILDAASVDLVNAQEGIGETLLASCLGTGEGKFRAVNGVDWSAQLVHASRLRLGTWEYGLIVVP